MDIGVMLPLKRALPDIVVRQIQDLATCHPSDNNVIIPAAQRVHWKRVIDIIEANDFADVRVPVCFFTYLNEGETFRIRSNEWVGFEFATDDFVPCVEVADHYDPADLTSCDRILRSGLSVDLLTKPEKRVADTRGTIVWSHGFVGVLGGRQVMSRDGDVFHRGMRLEGWSRFRPVGSCAVLSDTGRTDFQCPRCKQWFRQSRGVHIARPDAHHHAPIAIDVLRNGHGSRLESIILTVDMGAELCNRFRSASAFHLTPVFSPDSATANFVLDVLQRTAPWEYHLLRS